MCFSKQRGGVFLCGRSLLFFPSLLLSPSLSFSITTALLYSALLCSLLYSPFPIRYQQTPVRSSAAFIFYSFIRTICMPNLSRLLLLLLLLLLAICLSLINPLVLQELFHPLLLSSSSSGAKTPANVLRPLTNRHNGLSITPPPSTFHHLHPTPPHLHAAPQPPQPSIESIETPLALPLPLSLSAPRTLPLIPQRLVSGRALLRLC